MSSPAASLKKTRKSPLPTSSSRGVPFRKQPGHGFTAGELLGAREEKIASQHHQIVEGIRREGGGKKAGTPSDSDLVASMASRLAQAERELLTARRDILEKDHQIRRLQDQVAKLKASSSPQAAEELQQRCDALQQQVDDMEEFLNDYGMVWVGKDGGGGGGGGDVWLPGSSRVDDGPFTVDYDRILKNVQELNVLAGEHTALIKYTSSGAHLKSPDPVPLTLYKNGMMMFAGPFRPYSEPTTRLCIQDLTDGYFPSELQHRYPDGVPFKLVDRREVVYRPQHSTAMFPGRGTRLEGEQKGGGGGGGAESYVETTSVGPGAQPDCPQLSLQSFLSRLPKKVVREGRVIDIHSGLTETLKGPAGHVTLVDTPIVQEIRERLERSDPERPPTPGQLVTLRVKSEDGEETFVLKMRQSDTILDVRRHIDQQRPPSASTDYLIRCPYPQRTVLSDSSTLTDCGLPPSANLFLAKPHQTQEKQF